VEFRLIFQGKLPPESYADVDAKHEVRRQLHRQLAELWAKHPFLSRCSVIPEMALSHHNPDKPPKSRVEQIANEFASYGFRWVPLVCRKYFGMRNEAVGCELDILFLRRDPPGALINTKGDIDNRIKTLFDALRRPNNKGEIGDNTPLGGEDPFFVLLEDDSLITEIKVTTDRLLTPMQSGEAWKDVYLVIGVRTVFLGEDHG
jgi:hypothetical protein